MLPVRNSEIKGAALAAAGATSTIEIFDGVIGIVDAVGDTSIGAAGTGYEVGDLITLTPASGGTPLIIEVATVGGAGEVSTYTISQVGTGHVVGNTQATTTNSVAGADFTLDIDVVTDTGESVVKLTAVANTFAEWQGCVLSKNGISLRVTGASAQGYLYYS